jgi:hypothetical protein
MPAELINISESSHTESEDTSDADYPEPESMKRKRSLTQKSVDKKRTRHLPSVAAACDRTCICDGAAAFIVSSVLQDIGDVTQDDRTEVVDRSKIRRERKK